MGFPVQLLIHPLLNPPTISIHSNEQREMIRLRGLAQSFILKSLCEYSRFWDRWIPAHHRKRAFTDYIFSTSTQRSHQRLTILHVVYTTLVWMKWHRKRIHSMKNWRRTAGSPAFCCIHTYFPLLQMSDNRVKVIIFITFMLIFKGRTMEYIVVLLWYVYIQHPAWSAETVLSLTKEILPSICPSVNWISIRCWEIKGFNGGQPSFGFIVLEGWRLISHDQGWKSY
jgi:hypothetical protein